MDWYCERCRRNYSFIGFSLRDAVRELNFCPNCLAVAFYNNELSFINDPTLVDDITDKPGAVEFKSENERYVLERRTMMRLISHNLRRSEYLALAKKYGSEKYMIHDDFYAEDGTALQPMI